jgi:hypothetical protein
MKNLLKVAASPFMTFDDDLKEAKPASNSIPSFQSHPFDTVQPVAATSNDLSKFQNYFTKLMDDSNLPGPDYYEFRKALDSLEKAIPDEHTRFVAAFAGIAASGATKEILISTAKQYLDLLSADKDKFVGAIGNKQNAEITNRESQIAAEKQAMDECTKIIQQKTQEIADHQIKISKLESEKTSANQKIQANQQGYLTAQQIFCEKINSDLNKIQALL